MGEKSEKISPKHLNNLRTAWTTLEKNLEIKPTNKQFTEEQKELLKDMDNQMKALGFLAIYEGEDWFYNKNDELETCVGIYGFKTWTDESINEKIPYKTEFTAAGNAGLYEGSKILAVGDQKVHSREELFVAFYKYIETQKVEPNKPIAPVKITMIPAKVPYDFSDSLSSEKDAQKKDFDLSCLAHWIDQKQKNNPQKNVNEV